MRANILQVIIVVSAREVRQAEPQIGLLYPEFHDIYRGISPHAFGSYFVTLAKQRLLLHIEVANSETETGIFPRHSLLLYKTE